MSLLRTARNLGIKHRRGRLVSITAGLGALALTAVALTGCSSSSGSSGSSGSSDQTITFYSWDNAAIMKPIITAFEKANPTITVQASYGTPVDGYISTLQTRLSSGTAADVFIITAENKTQIMDGGFAKNLSSQPFASNLAPSAKANYSKGGKLYGAAVASWGGGILYNRALLAKAGVTTPPTTWAQFLDVCKKLKAAGITPYYEAGDQISETLSALVGIQNEKMNGTMDQQIWSGKSSFAKSWATPLAQWDQLFTKGLVPSSSAGLTSDQVTTEFEKGSVAMISTGSWGLGAIQTAAPSLKLGFFAVPGKSSTYWAGAVSPGYAVNAKSTHSAAALKFVDYLQSKPAVKAYQKETASITTTKDFNPPLSPVLKPMVADVRDGKFYLPGVSWPTESDAMTTEATSLQQELMNGQIDPSQMAAQMDAKLKALKG